MADERRSPESSAEEGRERTTPRRRSPRQASKVDGDQLVREKLSSLPEPSRTLALQLHELIRSTAPELTPRLWYGLPAYAKDGAVICFFRVPETFEERYFTLGFNDKAKLDDPPLWPVAYALTELTPDAAQRIAELVRRALG